MTDDTYTIQIFYRTFEPHESGPSRAPIFRDRTFEQCKAILREFQENKDCVVLDAKCWVNKRVSI